MMDRTEAQHLLPPADPIQRYSPDFRDCLIADQQKNLHWIFSDHHATAYARAIEHGCVKDRGVMKTVEKIESANIIPHDESNDSYLLRSYLESARKENNPVYLLSCILNSSFYKIINYYMVTGDAKHVFEKLSHKWSGYYTGLLMQNPLLDSYRYCGTVFRGMNISMEDLLTKYKIRDVFTNKTFQSTSKSQKVALQYTCMTSTEMDVNVIMIYNILDSRFALDVEHESQCSQEQEVLLLPGCLFEVRKVDDNKNPIEIDVLQILTHNA
ncbi:hypothetical protein I4U23_015077 [Adineta vaga]|nr:hypothetical protein I4U23_015077 [Adineta vaga]